MFVNYYDLDTVIEKFFNDFLYYKSVNIMLICNLTDNKVSGTIGKL